MKTRMVILCIDDEKVILDALEHQLSSHLGKSFIIETAQSGEEALSLLDELNSGEKKLAVVISDHLMPHMKGDDVLIAIHQRCPETHKILLTGEAKLEAVHNAINKARLYRYVIKPWEEHDLMLTVEEAVRSFQQYLQLLEYNRLLHLLNTTTQELAGELYAPALMAKFTRRAIEIIGAEVGYVIFEQNGKYLIEAPACLDPKKDLILKEKFKQQDPELLKGIVNHFNITHKGDAESQVPYRLVEKIAKKKGDPAIGYALIENTFSKEEFNSYHSEILQMMAAQTAISLENAMLYKSLESKTQELQEEKEVVEQKNILIEQKNKDVTDSIRYARRIQEAIIPNEAKLRLFYPNSFVLYRPKDIVSGDFYWLAEKEHYLLLAVVDCTGHGVPGAFMSVLGSTILDRVTVDFSVIEPDATLQMLDIQVRTTLHQNQQSETHDGMDIMYCTIDTKQNIIYCAGARRPLYLIRNQQLQEYAGTRFSIGETCIDEEPFFQSHTLNLEPDDTVYIFTDGIADQFGGQQHKKFTTNRLKDLLLKIQNYSMAQQAEVLNRAIDEWRGEIEQTDDILIIGMRF